MGQNLRGAASFLRGFENAYNLGTRIGMQVGLSRAADVKQEKIDSTALTDTTPGADGMVYDEDTGQYLPKYLGLDNQPTEQAQAQQNTPIDGASEAPDGVRPTFDATTTTRHRMGGKVQDTPFTPAQVDAERFRQQAGVFNKFGAPDQAARMQSMARASDEIGTTEQIREAATKGLKNSRSTMREEERQLAMTRAMYDEAVRLGRPDLASQYYAQFDQARTGAMKRATDRADTVYRSTGNISGYVDAYNRYMADGLTISSYAPKDGGWEFTVESDGKTQTISVPKEKISDYLMALSDLDRVRAIEQKRGEIAFKARADSQEALNKPVVAGKDQTVVIPATGQTFSPRGANATIDPKEYNGVLDDINKMILERSGNFDQMTGKWNYSPDAVKKSSLGQRLFVGNPSLTPAQVVEIVDSGQTGTAEVDVGGRRQRVPAINYNGRTFLLGGNEAGMPQPATPAKAPAPTGQPEPTTTGLGTRDVRGKIQQPATNGLQRAPSSTPADFPRVSSAEQQSRDKEAGMLLVQESGGPDKARALVAKMRDDIRNPLLDGTRKQMLRSHVARIELALADLENGG